MRKEVEEIVSAKLKEGKIEGNNTSTENLLNHLIKINEEQNKLLERNNLTSNKFNLLLLILASSSFFAAFASTQIAALQLQAANQDWTGMGIFYLLCFIVGGLVVYGWYYILSSLKGVKEST